MNKNLFDDKLKAILDEDVSKIVISNPTSKESVYKKIVITKRIIKNTDCYQIERFTDKQAFHENIRDNELADKILDIYGEYKQINIFSSDNEHEIKFNRNRDFVVNSKINHKKSKIIPMSNNREKSYILSEGMEIPLFVDLGIFTKDYKIVNSKYNKFKQINRFTELLADLVKDYSKETINIIDFGCGKSYLTFVIYYYLVKVKGIKANIIGLDLKTDVIDECNRLVQKYGYDGIRFEVGDINGYEAPFDVDLVITLHACDTATDYALFNAVSWNAQMILSVPCCQHEVNKQIRSDELSALTKYGIIKERTSAIITDAIRGCMLEYSGYKTELLEFIDIEHSPKNILIRAKKTNYSVSKRQKSLGEAQKISDKFSLDQTLMRLLEANK